MARRNLKKPIVETDKPGGKIIKYWPSAKEAAAFYHFTQQVIISYNVKGITKQAKGHYFRYATKEEIAQYEAIEHQIANQNAESNPVEPLNNIELPPAEVIPEHIQKPETQSDDLSPFERLLLNSKKKFNDNSD